VREKVPVSATEILAGVVLNQCFSNVLRVHKTSPCTNPGTWRQKIPSPDGFGATFSFRRFGNFIQTPLEESVRIFLIVMSFHSFRAQSPGFACMRSNAFILSEHPKISLGASGKSSIDSIMTLIMDLFFLRGRAQVYPRIAKTNFAIVWAKVPNYYSVI
jgi:hypothetical protein